MSDTDLVIDPADTPPPATIAPNPDYVPAYVERPAHWAYDIDQANGSSRATYWGEVYAGGQAAGNRIATQADIAASTTGVSSWNTRTGAVTLTTADITSAGGAPSNNPTFVGIANAATPTPGTNTTQLATTQFVQAAIGAAAGVATWNGRQGAVTMTLADITTAGGAPLASPALTGTPTTPTASVGNQSGQVASTQFVANAIAAGSVVSWNGRQGAVTLTLSDITSAGGAPLASPAFTGVPSVPTATPGTATTQAASTAFVTNAVIAASSGVASFNTRTGAVTLQLADITGAGGAPIVSPAITGNPTAPTQTTGTSNTTLATTAFVANAISSLPGVSSFNGRQGTVTLQLADVTSVGGAPLASPALSGSPTTTTPPPGDNSNRIADTAFVAASYAPLASPTLTGTPTVPTASPGTNTTQAASTAFVEAATTAATGLVTQAAYDNVGRNLLHNGLFNVQQRGMGPWTASNNYTADRWILQLSLDSASVALGVTSDANRTAVGDEALTYLMQNIFTGNSGAGAYNAITQRIESVRRLSGKTVIVSFWAAASAAGMKLGSNIYQSFGSGGSPSAPVNTPGQAVTLTTTLARYSMVFAVPSASGMTFGTTENTDFSQLSLWFSSGATNAATAGNIGVQSGTIWIWGIQLEIAAPGQTQPTPLEKPDPRYDLSNCQRFYQIGAAILNGNNSTSASLATGWSLPVSMRAQPTTTTGNISQTNASGVAVQAQGPSNLYLAYTVGTSGPTACSVTWTASADL